MPLFCSGDMVGTLVYHRSTRSYCTILSSGNLVTWNPGMSGHWDLETQARRRDLAFLLVRNALGLEVESDQFDLLIQTELADRCQRRQSKGHRWSLYICHIETKSRPKIAFDEQRMLAYQWISESGLYRLAENAANLIEGYSLSPMEWRGLLSGHRDRIGLSLRWINLLDRAGILPGFIDEHPALAL
jgi:hypothetical protein